MNEMSDILSGHAEKQAVIQEKINSELKVLPSIFSDYCLYLRDTKKSDSTIFSYITTLTACLRTIYQDYYIADELFYEKIKVEDIEYYFEAKKDLSIKVLQRHWSSLNSFFNFLNEKSYTLTNPMAEIRRPVESNVMRKLNHLNREELDRLLTTIKHNPTKFTSFRDEIIIKLAISTGIDVSDLLNLNFEDINFDGSYISIINKKGERHIPIGESMLILLKKWGQFRNQYFKGIDSPALFISTMKHRLSVDAVTHMLEKNCEQANVHRITYKDLKSTMVYLLAQKNVSMEAIMKFIDVSDYLIVVQAYDAAMKEKNININKTIDEFFESPIDATQKNKNECIQHNFSVQIKAPEYATYQGGESGFTIFVNVNNNLDIPLKLKLKSCSIFTNGMLRSYNYSYSGYQFNEEYIFPKTIKTFGKIWITDSLRDKKLQHNDYLLLCMLETNSNIEHYIKYIYNENEQGSFWIASDWYEINATES